MIHSSRGIVLAVLLCIVVLSAGPACSESAATKQHQFIGLGIQAAPFPIIGLSVRCTLNQRFSLQAIGKTGYDVDILAARGLLTISSRERSHWYLAGLAGYFRDPDVSRGLFAPDEEDAAPGFGVGIGWERALGATQRFSLNAEIDYIHIHFKDVWWEYEYKRFNLVMIGFGLNYYLM